MPKQVDINPFVRRQTAKSRFSHFEPRSGNPADTWTELEAIARRYSKTFRARPSGPIQAVRLPDNELHGFFSGVVEVDEQTKFKTVFAPRADGELPYIQTVAVNGKKTPAKAVELIFYHRSQLPIHDRTYTPKGSDTPVVLNGLWQLISINARASIEPEPPTPQAMARNTAAALGLPEGVGGTARHYTPEEWMRAVLYWSQRTMSAGT